MLAETVAPKLGVHSNVSRPCKKIVLTELEIDLFFFLVVINVGRLLHNTSLEF